MSFESLITIVTAAIVPAAAYLVSIGIFTRQNTEAIKAVQVEMKADMAEMRAQMKVDHDMLVRLDEKADCWGFARPAVRPEGLSAAQV